LSGWWLGHAIALAGRDDEACEVFERAAAAGPSFFSDMAELGRRSLRGDQNSVRAVVAEGVLLKEMASTDEFYPCFLASYLAHVGETADALGWLERAVGWGFTNHRFLAVHNRFLVSLRGDARFEALIERAREKERAFEV
jgi:hypothetical protein